jgi:crotonobetainyl-CoA:carnitine CoA-transferase CaiB-like acyl-CoA transferase
MLVESFRPGVLEAMGLPPAALLEANPRLVIVRVSGWGQDGPYRHKPGFGTLVEGYSGFAAINGFADREPVLPPMFMADAYAGLYGATAAMMALRHAEATGEGQVIDLSLFEPIFAILEPQMANYAMSGVPKPRTGSRSTNTAPRNAYRTKDGRWVGLSSSTQSVFERLMRSIGQEALLADPRFATNSDRLRHIEAIDQVVRDAVAAMTLEEALAQFDRDGVTIGPILDVADLARDAYVREREALIAVPDEEMPGGLLPMHGQVPRLSRTPGLLRNPAPRLGEDTRRLLAAALGEAEAERLIEAGVAIACRR